MTLLKILTTLEQYLLFQDATHFCGYWGLRTINSVTVSSAPKSDSKSQVSIYFCHLASEEIKPWVSDLQVVKCLRVHQSPSTRHQEGSLHSRAARTRKCIRHLICLLFKNDVTIHKLVNSLKRKLCPSWIAVRATWERHAQRKQACLLEAIPWTLLAGVVFRLCPIQGRKTWHWVISYSS